MLPFMDTAYDRVQKVVVLDKMLTLCSLGYILCCWVASTTSQVFLNLDIIQQHHTMVLTGHTGNRPPWTNEIKAAYLKYDSRRAAERVGLFGIQGPPDLMAVSHTVSPLRALHYIKANYPKETFLATFESLFKAFWTPPHVNLIPEENLRAVLQGATENPGKGGGKKLFTEEEVEKILKARGGMKDVLMATTQRAVDQGAFGAPWIWVTNAKGEQEPFFGSDR